MNSEVVEEMFDRLIKIKEVKKRMIQQGAYTMETPHGPVKMSELRADEKFIESMLIDELNDLPITGILVNLI